MALRKPVDEEDFGAVRLPPFLHSDREPVQRLHRMRDEFLPARLRDGVPQ
jgi:hypothetical protein